MSEKSTQRLLVVLLALAALGATALVALTVIARNKTPEAAIQVQVRSRSFASTTPDQSPPVMFALPSFSLLERSGRKLDLDDLRGKVWIASFIFTRCTGPCPAISARMAGLQKQLAGTPGWDRIRLVSFSVDPEHDRPDVLTAYAKGFDADPEHWLMLTGDKKEVWPLVRTGFKLAVGDAPPDSVMPIMHSMKFVLVDGQGRVRGYYDGLEAPAREKLTADLRRLLDEPVPPGRP